MRNPPAILLTLLGAGAGFASGFLGIGGGLIIVPALMLGFGCPLKRAVGISLATIVFVSSAGVLVELSVKRTNIHWVLALVLMIGSVLGSVAGAKLLRRLPEPPLRALFAGSLLLAAYRMTAAVPASGGAGLLLLDHMPAVGYLLALPVGGLAGAISTLFGLGGGIVTVPCLSLLFGDVPFHAARATALVTIVPTACVGAFQHQRMGTIDFSVARRLIPTGLAGAALGVVCVNFIPPSPCRFVFAGFLALTAVRLLAAGRPELARTATAPD